MKPRDPTRPTDHVPSPHAGKRRPSIWLRAPMMGALSLVLCALARPSVARAQAPAPPLVPNGDFGGMQVEPDLWDGVDANNNLHVYTYQNVVTSEGGSAESVKFPCSPQFADMDGDGLKDLVVGDPSGFIWIYKNVGEKGKPKFATGQFVPSYYGGAAKIWVGDYSGNGRNDIVVGTIFGHVFYVPNLGSPQKWLFTRDMGKPRYMWPGAEQQGFELPYLTLGKQPMLFGTYMSPCVYDWDKDGKKDLILGDGTYSANSIWLLRNLGSNLNPRFDPDEKYYLAYGEGREQLVPTIADLNGDGLPDLIVADRQGYINLYLNSDKLPKPSAKPSAGDLPSAKMDHAPAVLPFTEHIKLGGQEKFAGPLAVSACDWDDSGMVDLLLGYPDGTVAVALNKGTKTQYKFDAPQLIKGADTEKDFKTPTGWRYQYSGNANSCFTVRVLEHDQLPNGEKIEPKIGKYMCRYAYEHDYPGWFLHGLFDWCPAFSKSGPVVGGRPIVCTTGKLTIGKKYEVSAWVRGADVKPIWGIETLVSIRSSRRNRAEPAVYAMEAPFAVTEAGWSQFNKTFICPGPTPQQRILKPNNPDADKISFSFYFTFPGKGYCFLNDVRLEEVKGIGGMPAPTPPPAPK